MQLQDLIPNQPVHQVAGIELFTAQCKDLNSNESNVGVLYAPGAKFSCTLTTNSYPAAPVVVVRKWRENDICALVVNSRKCKLCFR